jgi:hypothetical protein
MVSVRISMKLSLTYCSGKKRIGIDPPDQLYDSNRISSFINKCEDKSCEWAIFSAQYALFFPKETKPNYDVTFKADPNYWLGIAVLSNGKKLSIPQSKEHVEKLVSTIKYQADKMSVDQIIFYGPSPKMMKSYLAILHYTFDECLIVHDWQGLIKHVNSNSKKISVINNLNLITQNLHPN